MFLSREIQKKTVSTLYKNLYIPILYKTNKFRRIIFSKYTTNLKTTIAQRSPRNLGALLLSFEFNYFSFLKDIIDKIIYTSVSSDQYSHQWQCSLLVTLYIRSHVIMILHCHWWEFWSLDTDIFIILSIISIKNNNKK